MYITSSGQIVAFNVDVDGAGITGVPGLETLILCIIH